MNEHCGGETVGNQASEQRGAKRHWKFQDFVCTGRGWQEPTMHFTNRKALVSCKICRSLLRLHGKLP